MRGRSLAGKGYALLSAAAILRFGATACAQNAPSPGAELATAADSELRRRASSGWSGAVIIEFKGRVVLRSGYGLANRERGIPFTPQTIAQVGSITKQFTAAAIVALAGERRLAFTDSLARLLPEVRGAARSVTLHELLTHSSGLPAVCGNDFDTLTVGAFLARCVNSDELKTRGSYVYSNPGYSVLGIVVERVSGQLLEKYLDERFFRPLGLSNIAYQFPNLPSELGPAVCYQNGVAQRTINDRIADCAARSGHSRATAEYRHRPTGCTRGIGRCVAEE